MIQSFKDRDTRRFYDGQRVREFDGIKKAAARKLDMLNAAANLNDLRSPPGNRLEALAGDRAGQHSIRINDQYRVCFEWTEQGPANVEITDYH
ncbi:MAG TPA: type II toxin-antitoxin system RelE/ParE family toxin [Stellaceae bacterium]|jgi:proteic killer suppression protein